MCLYRSGRHSSPLTRPGRLPGLGCVLSCLLGIGSGSSNQSDDADYDGEEHDRCGAHDEEPRPDVGTLRGLGQQPAARHSDETSDHGKNVADTEEDLFGRHASTLCTQLLRPQTL